MNENLQSLYDSLYQRRLYTKPFDEFATAYSTVNNQKYLHTGLVSQGLYEGDFDTFQKDYFLQEGTPAGKLNNPVTSNFGEEESSWLQSSAIGGIASSVIANSYAGSSTDEVLELMGNDPSDEDMQKWIQASKEFDKYGITEAREAFNKKIQEEGDTAWNTVSAYWENPSVIFEDALGSFSRFVTAPTTYGAIAGSVATGAAAGSVVPGAGTAAGAAAGFRFGIGSASGIIDATAYFSEELRSEMQRRNLQLTKDNVKQVLEDEEWLTETKNNAIKGGFAVGVIDFLTVGMAGKAVGGVTGKLAKSAVGTGVEVTGGMVGEATAELARGEEVSPSQILAEGFGEFGMRGISVAGSAAGKGAKAFNDIINPPTYKVSGRKYTREEFQNFINSEKNLLSDKDGNELSIEINNDRELSKLLDEKRATQRIDNEIDSNIQGDDRARLIELEKEREKKSKSPLRFSKIRVQEIDQEIQEIKDRASEQPQADPVQPEPEPVQPETPQQPKRVVYHVTIRDNKESIQEKGLEKDRPPTFARGVLGIDVFDTAGKSFVFSNLEEATKWSAKTKIEKEKEVSIVAINAEGKNFQEDESLTQDPFYPLSSALFTEDVISPDDILSIEDVTVSQGKILDKDGNPFTEESFGKLFPEAPKPTEQQPSEEQATEEETTQEKTTEAETAEETEEKKPRRFAVRAAKTMKEIKDDILNNPNNYYTPQKIAEIQERLETLSMGELLSEMKDAGVTLLRNAQDETGILAGLEAMNRAYANGDFALAAEIQQDLAMLGTNIGRLLRHFGELKSSTPQSMIDSIVRNAERKGTTLSDNQKKRLQELVNPVFQLQREVQAQSKQLQNLGNATPERSNILESEVKESSNKLKAAERQLEIWMNSNIQRGLGNIGKMLIQGNLLTPMSQMTNIVANLVNLGLAVPRDILALPIERVANLFNKGIPQNRQYSFGAYLHAIRMFGRGVKEASLEVAGLPTDDYVTEWRVQRGFLPLISFLTALHGVGGERVAKRLGLQLEAPSSSKVKIELWLQATLGVPAELMFRLLGLGDKPFRRFIEGKNVYQEAKRRGLKGQEFKNFVKYPPEEVFQEAAREGRKLTFQERTSTSDFFEGQIQKLEGTNAAIGFLLRTQVPYVRTPANILSESVKYAVPALGIGSVAMKLHKGNVRDASQDLAKVILGGMITAAAGKLLEKGLVSGDIEYEEDESKKNIAYDQFPPNSINLSGVRRFINGGDPSVQPNDEFFSYNKLGLPGAIIGIKATLNPSRNDEKESMDLINTFFGIEALSTVNHIMDQSFLQGVNNIINVLGSTEEAQLKNRFERWGESTMKVICSIAMPNTLSAINRTRAFDGLEFLPDVRILEEMSTSERLAKRFNYIVRDRTFRLDDAVPVRVNWKGQPIRQTPAGANRFAYQLFDVTKSRRNEADTVSNEIYGLYERTGELSDVVSTPYFARARSISIPDLNLRSKKEINAVRAIGKNYTFLLDKEFTQGSIRLNTEQINNLMRVAGQERYALAQAVMQNPAYINASDKNKLEYLNNVNDLFRKQKSFRADGKSFRNHTILLFDILEEIYRDEQREED